MSLNYILGESKRDFDNNDNPNCFIQDISTTEESRHTIFGVILSVKYGNPIRLFVTDFTTNPAIANSFSSGVKVNEDEYFSSDKILQISVFDGGLGGMLVKYKEKFGEPLFDESLYDTSTFKNISDKCCFVEISAYFKVFRYFVDGKLNDIKLIDAADINHNKFKEHLYANFFKAFNKNFVSTNYHKIKKSVPTKFIPSLCHSEHDELSNKTRRSELNSLYTPNSSGNSLGIESNSQRIETATSVGFVKGEEEDVDFIPDTQYDEDFHSSIDPATSPDADFESKESSLKRFESIFEDVSADKDLERIYTIAEIMESDRWFDEKIYRTRAKVIGKEESIETICSKPFVLDSKSVTYSSNYANLRDLELTITDSEELPTLSFMKITIPKTDLLNFFHEKDTSVLFAKSRQVEQLFVNEVLGNEKVIEFQLYKKVVPINRRKSVLKWCAKGLCLTDILKR